MFCIIYLCFLARARENLPSLLILPVPPPAVFSYPSKYDIAPCADLRVSLTCSLFSVQRILFFSRSVLASFSLALIFVYIRPYSLLFHHLLVFPSTTFCSAAFVLPARGHSPDCSSPCPSSRRSFPEIYVRYSGCYKLCHCNRRKTSRKHVVCAQMRNIGRRAATSLSLKTKKN